MAATLNRENYFSPDMMRRYCSVSQFKAFRDCEAAGLAEVEGKYTPRQTEGMLLGSYMDSLFETQNGAAFFAEHPDSLKRNGEIKAEFQAVRRIFDRVTRDRMFQKYTMGEQQVVMTGIIADVPVKIMIDSYLPGRAIVDRKLMADLKPKFDPKTEQRVPWFAYWGYDVQAAVYQEIVRQNTGERLPFFLAPMTKTDPTQYDLVLMPDDITEKALEEFEEYVPRIEAIKIGAIVPERCEECAFCLETKTLTEPTNANEYYFDI